MTIVLPSTYADVTLEEFEVRLRALLGPEHKTGGLHRLELLELAEKLKAKADLHDDFLRKYGDPGESDSLKLDDRPLKLPDSDTAAALVGYRTENRERLREEHARRKQGLTDLARREMGDLS